MSKVRRRGKVEMELVRAVESDDTLAILKAQRKMIVELVTSPNLEVKEKTQLMTHLTRVNIEIQKLDGTRKDFTDEEMEEFEAIEELRL